MQGVELIKRLCACFGPTSLECEVADAVREELSALNITPIEDRMGNLLYHLEGPQGAPRVMLAAHMDEVGFMVTEIEEEGFIRFDNVGGIDRRVLCGRQITLSDGTRRVPGVIAAKGIHMQDAEERKKTPTSDELYIDIGADSREAAERLVSPGDLGVFDTECRTFGKNGAYLCGKALDDRAGCALLIEILRAVADERLPLDLWFAFTVREEIGKSGAGVAANRIAPDFAVILETTAIGDRPDSAAHKRVAAVGEGGVLSLLDRGTIYDRAMVERALAVAAEQNIPVQIKKYVSGGNDAARIQRSGSGVRCMALSAPTRYLHAPVSVMAVRDYEAMRALVCAMLKNWKVEPNV